MERKTIVSILAHIQTLQDQLNTARHEMGQLNMFHNEIMSIATSFSFDSEAQQLAISIQNRDFPLTRSEIRSIFETSGFAYNNEHIDAAAPDRDDQVETFRNEQVADYTSVYGNDGGWE
jgi:hypothetical protein